MTHGLSLAQSRHYDALGSTTLLQNSSRHALALEVHPLPQIYVPPQKGFKRHARQPPPPFPVSWDLHGNRLDLTLSHERRLNLTVSHERRLNLTVSHERRLNLTVSHERAQQELSQPACLIRQRRRRLLKQTEHPLETTNEMAVGHSVRDTQ